MFSKLIPAGDSSSPKWSWRVGADYTMCDMHNWDHKLEKKKRLHCCLRCVRTLQFVWVLTASSGLIDWKACSPFADVFLSIDHLLKLVQPQTLAGCCSPASTYQTLRNKCLWANKKPNIIFLKHKNEFAQFKIPIELRSVESRSQWADLSDISWWFYWLPSSHPEYQTANAVAVTYWATVFYSWVQLLLIINSGLPCWQVEEVFSLCAFWGRRETTSTTCFRSQWCTNYYWDKIKK